MPIINSPLDLGSDLISWHNAKIFLDPPYSYTSNTPISAWPDSGPNHYDLTVGGTPLFRVFDVAVDFSSVTNNLSLAYSGAVAAAPAPISVGIVFEFHDNFANPILMVDTDGMQFSWDHDSQRTHLVINQVGPVTADIYANGPIMPNMGPYAVVQTFDNTLSFDWAHVVQDRQDYYVAQTFTNDDAIANGQIKLGNSLGLNTQFMIKELVLFKNVGVDYRMDLANYFYTKWFVPAAILEPQNQTIFHIAAELPFTHPTDLGTDLLTWYDAAQFIAPPYNFTTDTEISEWSTPPTFVHPELTLTSSQSVNPTVKLNQLNGLPAVHMKGDNSNAIELQGPNGLNEFRPWAISAVLSNLTATNNYIYLFDFDAFNVGYGNNSNSFIGLIYSSSFHDTFDLYKTDSWILNQPFIVTFIFDGPNSRYRINRAEITSLQHFNTNFGSYTPSDALYIYSSDPSFPDIHEFLVYQNFSSYVDSVENYLHNKWMAAPPIVPSLAISSSPTVTFTGVVVPPIVASIHSIYTIPVDVFPHFPPKAPNDIQDYDFEFNRWLDAGETILSASFNVPSPVILVAQGISGSRVKVLLGGGVSRTYYPISCQITTLTGRKKTAHFTLRIE